LNTDKTQAIWFGSRAYSNNLSSHDRTLTIDETTINTTDVVRNLGVLLDSRIIDDATRRQGCVRLFLPHSPFAPDPPTCWTGSHYTTRSCLGHNPPWLLQFSTDGFTAIDLGAILQRVQNCAARL